MKKRNLLRMMLGATAILCSLVFSLAGCQSAVPQESQSMEVLTDIDAETLIGEYYFEIPDANDPDISDVFDLKLSKDGTGYWTYPGADNSREDVAVTWNETALMTEDGEEYPITLMKNEDDVIFLQVKDFTYEKYVTWGEESDYDYPEVEEIPDNSVWACFESVNREEPMFPPEENELGQRYPSVSSMSNGVVLDDIYIQYFAENQTYSVMFAKTEEEEEADFQEQLKNMDFYFNNAETAFTYDQVTSFHEGDAVYQACFVY